MGAMVEIQPGEMPDYVSAAQKRLAAGEVGAEEGLRLAFRLAQWSQQHFKVAKGGRADVRGAIVSLTTTVARQTRAEGLDV
eukprot:14324490-Alexandrium_andersonii.AAC.1